jgi:hypothetical protein
MDEIKQSAGIENVLRQVAKHRDKLLRKVPALSPARQAILTDCLAREFPLETALRGAATKRDQLLPPYRSGIPRSVESILHRRLDALDAAGLARAPRRLNGLKRASSAKQRLRRGGILTSDLVRRTSVWLTFFRSPPGISFTACALIIAALLCFGSGRTSSVRHAVLPKAPRPDEVNVNPGTDLFIRRVSIRPFNLNTSEPASLQASIVAINRMRFDDGIKAALDLRLDLPERAILMEGSLARTP